MSVNETVTQRPLYENIALKVSLKDKQGQYQISANDADFFS